MSDRTPEETAEQWNDKPEFKRTFLEMIAEARAWRSAGGVSLRRPVREFNGREDYDLRKTMEYWE